MEEVLAVLGHIKVGDCVVCRSGNGIRQNRSHQITDIGKQGRCQRGVKNVDRRSVLIGAVEARTRRNRLTDINGMLNALCRGQRIIGRIVSL